MCAQKNNENKKSNPIQSNPFSFKNYVDPGTDETCNLEGKDNPFSFKNFLSEETSLPNLNELPDVPPIVDQALDLPEIAQDIIPDVDWTDADASLVQDDHLLTDLSELEIQNDKRTIAKQREKIEKLEKKLKLLMDKEENENKTLEMVARQVEKSLEEATKRAIASENTVEIQRIEIAQLKAQVKALSNENVLLKTANMGGNRLFVTIGEIANEINEAALAAENSLTYLGAGVSTLRLIASRLQSLEKISEIIN